MRDYLGVEVPDDANGVLQDVHWAGGAFGYFPTYALGNVIAGQLWDLAGEALPDLDDQIGRGELTPLREWLRELLHRHGAKFEPAEMIKRITGGPLDTAPLLRQLEAKYADVYGLGLDRRAAARSLDAEDLGLQLARAVGVVVACGQPPRPGGERCGRSPARLPLRSPLLKGLPRLWK